MNARLTLSRTNPEISIDTGGSGAANEEAESKAGRSSRDSPKQYHPIRTEDMS